MGISYIKGKVKGPRGKQAVVKLLIDSGATYTLLPKTVWKAIGLKPKRKMSFTLADDTTIDRAVSEVYLKLSQGEAHTPVILGEEADKALLGIVTLEILGLVFNPFNRTLQPMRMLLCLGESNLRSATGIPTSVNSTPIVVLRSQPRFNPNLNRRL